MPSGNYTSWTGPDLRHRFVHTRSSVGISGDGSVCLLRDPTFRLEDIDTAPVPSPETGRTHHPDDNTRSVDARLSKALHSRRPAFCLAKSSFEALDLRLQMALCLTGRECHSLATKKRNISFTSSEEQKKRKDVAFV
ncbi:hypothetical protein ZHAS_00008692 [Anopheles sinensis]|uniref:Uncharacterized protein n=1 Tax=Anopheles sinensis TaxID=74873 RepID=A0A084VT51_ANOSI|nr:hypothetical protein ZHAS_00008692 [Anopheles sinensis]